MSAITVQTYRCGRCRKEFNAHPEASIVESSKARGRDAIQFEARCDKCGWIMPQKYQLAQGD